MANDDYITQAEEQRDLEEQAYLINEANWSQGGKE